MKKAGKEKPARMVQSPPKKTTVQRLYDPPESSGRTECEETQKSESNPIPMQSIGNLLGTISQTPEADLFKPNFGRSFSFHGTSTWVRIGGCIQGNSFKLQVRNQHHTQTNDCSARVREEDPTPCMKEFDGTVFQEIEDSGVNPLMFQIEIERSGEITCNSNGLNLQLTFDTEADENMNYIILQQEAGLTQWQNITDECTTTHGLRNIEIPVKKSSKILVFRIKKSLNSLKHALLALIHGQVWFHILVYFLKKGGKIKLRIIGVSEKLYQNPKALKTAVTIAEGDKFLKGEETEQAKKLLKKGSLILDFCKNSDDIFLGKFDLGRNDIDKHAEWYKYNFDENDLKDNLEVKVSDKDGNVLWCIDLNEMFCDEVKDEVEGPVEPRVERPVNTKPEITSFDDEVCERHVPWLARHLSKDVEKVAMLLGVVSVEIEAIKQGEPQPEKRIIKILNSWRNAEIKLGKKPTWEKVRLCLEDETVGRCDVTRALLNEDELDDSVLLWLAHRIAASFRNYARVLGVPDCEIDMSSQNFEGVEKSCMDVLQRWRRRTRYPKVDDLIQALEHDIIQRHELAKEMSEKFCNKCAESPKVCCKPVTTWQQSDVSNKQC